MNSAIFYLVVLSLGLSSVLQVFAVPISARSARMSNAKDMVYIDKIRISCYENYSKLNK